MDIKDINASLDKMQSKLDEKLEANNTAHSSEITALKAEIVAFKEEIAKTEKYEAKNDDFIIAMGQKIEALSTEQTENVTKNELMAQLEDKKDVIASLSANKNSQERVTMTMDINAAAVDMGQGVAPNYPAVPIRDKFDKNIGTIIKFGKPILDIVPSESTDTDLFEEMYETTPEGAPAFVGELVDVPQISFDWDEENFKAQRVGVNTVISERVAMFQKELYNKMNGLVNRELFDKIATDLIAADGTGTNISGWKTLGTAFSAASTGIAAGELGTLTAANKIEILYAAITQLQQAGFDVKAIVLNPADATVLRLSKSSAGEFATPAQIDYLMSLITESQKITTGEFILLDTEYIRQKYPKQITVELFRDFSEAKKGAMAMVASAYLAQVRNKNYAQSICYGDFTTAAADLNA